MYLITILDIVSFFGTSFALLTILSKGWRCLSSRVIHLMVITLFTFTALYYLLLALEWSGLNKQLDWIEDIVGVMVPMIWAFVFFEFLHNIKDQELFEREQRLKIQALELVSLNENLTAAHNDLQRLNAHKDKFFSIIAHDLMGPFNTLLGFSSLLSNGVGKFDRDKIVEYSNAVNLSATQVFRLLENLLEWALLQMGGETFKPKFVDLKKIIDTNLKLFEPTTKGKGIQLSSNVQEPLIIFADIHMVDTIIRNLINNAIKFTSERGSITVNAKTNGNWAEIEVSDNGVGIPTDKIGDLFQLDKETSTMGTGGEIGTGLGLPLCKDIVEIHGGKINVDSTEGEGSTFRFTLPLHKS